MNDTIDVRTDIVQFLMSPVKQYTEGILNYNGAVEGGTLDKFRDVLSSTEKIFIIHRIINDFETGLNEVIEGLVDHEVSSSESWSIDKIVNILSIALSMLQYLPISTQDKWWHASSQMSKILNSYKGLLVGQDCIVSKGHFKDLAFDLISAYDKVWQSNQNRSSLDHNNGVISTLFDVLLVSLKASLRCGKTRDVAQICEVITTKCCGVATDRDVADTLLRVMDECIKITDIPGDELSRCKPDRVESCLTAMFYFSNFYNSLTVETESFLCTQQNGAGSMTRKLASTVLTRMVKRLCPAKCAESWTDFVLLMEALDETQPHVVKPYLIKYTKLKNSLRESHTENCCKLHFSVKWLNSAYHKGLTHLNSGIVKAVVDNYMTTDWAEMGLAGQSGEFLLSTLFPIVFNNRLFICEENEKEQQIAMAQLVDLSSVLAAELEGSFQRGLCQLIGKGTVGVFMQCFILSRLAPCRAWNSTSLEEIRNSVSHIKTIPHLSIRNSAMECFLIGLLRSCDTETVCSSHVMTCLFMFDLELLRHHLPEVIQLMKSVNGQTAKSPLAIVLQLAIQQNAVSVVGMHRRPVLSVRPEQTIPHVENSSEMETFVDCAEIAQRLGFNLVKEEIEQLRVMQRGKVVPDDHFKTMNLQRLLDECNRLKFLNTENDARHLIRQLWDCLETDQASRSCSKICFYARLLVLNTCDLNFSAVLGVDVVPVCSRFGKLMKESWDFVNDEISGVDRGRMCSQLICDRFILLDRFLSVLLSNAGDYLPLVHEDWLNGMVDASLDALEMVSGAEAVPIFRCVKHMLSLIKDPENHLARMVRGARAVVLDNTNSEIYQTLVQQFISCFAQPCLLLSCDKRVLKTIQEILLDLIETNMHSPVVCYWVSLRLWDAVEIIINKEPPGDHCLEFANTWSSVILKIAVFGPIGQRYNEHLVRAFRFVSRLSLPFSRATIQESIAWQTDTCIRHSRSIGISVICLLVNNISSESAALLASQLVVDMKKMFDDIPMKTQGCFSGSIWQRYKLRLLQCTLLLVPYLGKDHALAVICTCIDELCAEHIHASIRFYCEWICIFVIANQPDINFCGFEQQMAERRTGSICSWLAISCHILCLNAPKVAGLRSFLRRCIVWSASQNFVVRIWAIASIRQVHKVFERRLLVQNFDIEILDEIVDFKLETKNFMKNVEKVENDFYFGKMKIKTDTTVESVFELIPRFVDAPEDEIIPISYFKDFFPASFRLPLSIPKNSQLLFGESLIWKVAEKSSTDSAIAETNAMQKKIDPMARGDCLPADFRLELASDLDDLKIKTDAELGNRKCRDDENAAQLIFVASLIDKPTNLGGLCRSCEILGVSQLIIGSSQLQKDSQFQSLAVTSDKWIKITEVPPSDLAKYLIGMKSLGWSVVGAEQTTQSVSLVGFKFPRKCLLVMGHEKYGIPPELLHCMDWFVEIPQVGITRSFNVHVSGALMMWEWAKQTSLGVARGSI